MRILNRSVACAAVLGGWLGADLRAGLLDGLGLDSEVSREETKYTCVAKPPPKPPAQHSSAEGVPPLPLPAVPQRRTEKKNPPRPPVLIAKISTDRQSDWATNPADAQNLLRWMAKNLNVNFSTINLPQNNIPADPQAIPVLYRTGHDAFSFSPDVRERVREYLLRGGTLVLEACCGRRAFAESALREMQQLIPERPPYRLTADHPLFHSFFEVKDIQYRPFAQKAGAQNGDPGVIGIDVGCRTAVYFFRWDVSCGWDELPDSDEHHCLGYTAETAKQLGANLMAYITAERSAALPLSKALTSLMPIRPSPASSSSPKASTMDLEDPRGGSLHAPELIPRADEDARCGLSARRSRLTRRGCLRCPSSTSYRAPGFRADFRRSAPTCASISCAAAFCLPTPAVVGRPSIAFSAPRWRRPERPEAGASAGESPALPLPEPHQERAASASPRPEARGERPHEA